MEMLINTEHSVSEICFAVGFSDSAYFNRVFKKENNLSPRQYRAAVRCVNTFTD
jgi:two-component system response regulator YesN